MIRPQPPIICYGFPNVKILIFALAAVFTTVVFAQPTSDDSDPYKRDRYTGYGSPSDRLYEREGPEHSSGALTGEEYFHGLLSTVADFDKDGKEDIVFFRKLSPEHYILVVVSDYYNPYQWGERETILGEFHSIYAMYDLGVSRTKKDASYESNCPFYSKFPIYKTNLKSTESKTLDIDGRAIVVEIVEVRYALVIWENGEYKYFCQYIR